MRPALATPAEAREWFKHWGNSSEDIPSEQFFLFRVFREKVISLLCGKKLPGSRERPSIFLIDYLVGSSNCCYEDSPVGLDSEDMKNLPVGERESAVRLGTRLLEELRNDGDVDYALFEVESSDLSQPDSHGRLLFRIYAHAEDEVKKQFIGDSRLERSRFFVLDFPYQAPMLRTLKPPEVNFVEHKLVCCPLRPSLASPFDEGSLPAAVVERMLRSIYHLYWDCYDLDSPTRAVVVSAADRAASDFHEAYVKQGIRIPCFTLRAYAKEKFQIRH